MYQRPLHIHDDLPNLLALADHSPLSLPHVADWPYRFASWALDDPENTQGWFDDAGQLLSWVMLQTPFWAIDAVLHPDAPNGLYHSMLTWSATRASELRASGGGRPMWFISIAATCIAHRNDLESFGFIDVSEAIEDPWSKVVFALAEDRELVAAPLPQGMQIRSLRVPEEIDAYVALHREVFQSESMTVSWRTRTTQMLGYLNALDLVLMSETGDLCGFCVAWLRADESGKRAGQIEPLGIKESYRGRRLSQVMECARCMSKPTSSASPRWLRTTQWALNPPPTSVCIAMMSQTCR
jgi:hypothetical protein